MPDATKAFFDAVYGTIRWAKRLTGVVQNGSLPVYLGVILLVLVALPGSALLRGDAPELQMLGDDSLHYAVGGLVVVMAIATATVRRRLVAVLFLGAVGFGVGLLFVIQGAPDLALTQFLVETLALIIFVLVLRHLPDRFRPQVSHADRAARGVLAAAVGVFVFVFALVAGASRTAEPVSAEYLARSYPEAQGRNVVNVILVDFRALDTLGEVTVLVVAAMGIAGLVLAMRREPAADEPVPDEERASR